MIIMMKIFVSENPTYEQEKRCSGNIIFPPKLDDLIPM